GLDRSLKAAAFDVLADPECVIEKIEEAADDVFDDSLRAKPDRDADHARTRDQWCNLDPQRRQRHEECHNRYCDDQHVPNDRQESPEPSPTPSIFSTVCAST